MLQVEGSQYCWLPELSGPWRGLQCCGPCGEGCLITAPMASSGEQGRWTVLVKASMPTWPLMPQGGGLGHHGERETVPKASGTQRACDQLT